MRSGLRSKLGLPRVAPDLATRILVLDVPVDGRTLSLGLVADRVIEVATFEPEEIESAPDIGVPWRSEYIKGGEVLIRCGSRRWRTGGKYFRPGSC